MTSTITHLPATTTLTAEQALHSALNENLTDVLVCGYAADGSLVVRSSRMTRADALWLAEMLRRWTIGDAT